MFRISDVTNKHISKNHITAKSASSSAYYIRSTTLIVSVIGNGLLVEYNVTTYRLINAYKRQLQNKSTLPII